MKNRAWLFLIPALILVSLSAFVPIMTVINYSLHLLYPGSIPEFYGMGNYVELFQDEIFLGSIKSQFLFTFQILLIEIPLGLLVALAMPPKGKWLTLVLVLLGIPLLIPLPIVGMVWRVFTRADLGVVPWSRRSTCTMSLSTSCRVGVWQKCGRRGGLSAALSLVRGACLLCRRMPGTGW